MKIIDFCGQRHFFLISVLLPFAALEASTPVWTFWPQTPTSVAVASGETAEIRYTVKNQSTRTKELLMRPIQGVSANGVCRLAPKGNCILTLTINGSQLSKDFIGGPVLCEKGNAHQCYRPSPADIMRLFKKASPTVANFVVVGTYVATNITQRPLLATSQDSGQTWAFPSAVNTPIFAPNNTNPFSPPGNLLGVSCQNQYCITVGYYNEGMDTKTLLGVSQDQGLSWRFPEETNSPIFTPDNTLAFDFGDFSDVSCTTTNCVTVGSYRATSSTLSRPLIGVSHNAGQSWVFPSAPTTPVFTPNNTPLFQQGQLGKVSCQNTQCISVGDYSDGGPSRPLLALSYNNGDTWIYPSGTNSPVFTPNNLYPFNDGSFSGASCINNTCIASGNYHDTNDEFRAMLAVSQDNGSTWRFPTEITTPVFTPDNTNAYSTGGHFNDATCTATNCIAVGYYFDSIVQRPLLALTQDKSTTWVFPSAINAPLFTPDNTNAYQSFGFFHHTYCEGALCLAAGEYRDTNNIQRPLIVVSQDSGNTWIYPSSANAPIFTPDNSHSFSSGLFNNVSCQNNYCIASGNYQDSNNIIRPLVAISVNKGLTWSFPSAPTSPIFTPDNTYSFLELGQLHDSSVTSNFCLPHSLQFIH